MYKKPIAFNIFQSLLFLFLTSCVITKNNEFKNNQDNEGLKNLSFERVVITSPLKIGKRHRVAKETMIYSRIQPYDLYNNYLHYWIDRPLFLNRDLRSTPEKGFLEDVEIVKEYEINGFTLLANGYASFYKTCLSHLKRYPIDGFSFMPGFAWSNSLKYEKYLENTKLALESSYSPHINGKVPFFTYVTIPADQIKTIREKLAADGCKNILLFDDIWIDAFDYYWKHKNLSPELVKSIKDQFQKKFDVADGVIYANYYMYRNHLGNYTLTREVDGELAAKFLNPIIEEIYAMPQNSDKLLGFNIRHGYIGHISGINEAEHGTEQLRKLFDSAFELNPDIISLVEWNEANENTSFQPTVYNSKSMQRIIKFYSRKLKGLPATPNKGDDLGIPNMIVSSRQTIKLGERYCIELLNVPDSESNKSYSAQLTLKDENNNVIKKFDADHFKVNELTAITYKIPSELLSEYNAVVPELKVSNSNGENRIFSLQYTRIHPTICWNFKEVRQPLRDMLLPKQVQFNVTGTKLNGNYDVSCRIDAEEPLASLEVLNNEDEVYAVDKANEFDPANNYLFALNFSTKKTATRELTLKIPGIKDFVFRPWSAPYCGFGKWEKTGETVNGKLLFWKNGSKILLRIPRAAVNSNIDIDIEGLGKHSLKISDILSKGKLGIELPQQTDLHIELMGKLADHPVHIRENKTSFSTSLRSEHKFPCFQMRVITVSGKIYRSNPVFPQKTVGGTEKLNVFSCSAGKALSVKIPSDKITDIQYTFKPDYGTILRSPTETCWDAQLGAGFKYCDPFCFGDLPLKANRLAPAWVRSSGSWELNFDGIGNYLIIPTESLPHGSFYIEFECKTDTPDDQVLLRHFSHSQGSLCMYIANGKLKAAFASMGGNYNAILNELPLNIEFPVGRWVKVQISYDMNEMLFSVDGKMQRIPFKLRASNPKPLIFGGYSSDDKDIKGKNMKFFKGELRSFRIRHNASPELM